LLNEFAYAPREPVYAAIETALRQSAYILMRRDSIVDVAFSFLHNCWPEWCNRTINLHKSSVWTLPPSLTLLPNPGSIH
ncbi:hypothetical protein BZM27_52475, partial [Paraburkholderia steynii]